MDNRLLHILETTADEHGDASRAQLRMDILPIGTHPPSRLSRSRYAVIGGPSVTRQWRMAKCPPEPPDLPMPKSVIRIPFVPLETVIIALG